MFSNQNKKLFYLSCLKFLRNDETFLMAGHYCIKTWSNPTGKRELLWSCGLSSNQIYNLDTLVSFLDKFLLLIPERIFFQFLFKIYF